MGSAAQLQNQQVYYDAQTGQYYTETPSNSFRATGTNNFANAALKMLRLNNNNRTYLTGINNNKIPEYALPTVNPIPTIAEMFPLMQGATQQAISPDLVSYGAGRFLTPAQAQATGGVLNSTGNKTT